MEKSPPRRNNKAQSTYINLLCMNQRSGRYLRAKWLLTGGRACFSFTLNLVLSLHVHLSMFIFSRIMHFFCLFSKIQKESFLLPLVWSRFLVFQWLWINTRFDMIQRGGGMTTTRKNESIASQGTENFVCEEMKRVGWDI